MTNLARYKFRKIDIRSGYELWGNSSYDPSPGWSHNSIVAGSKKKALEYLKRKGKNPAEYETQRISYNGNKPEGTWLPY